MTDTLDRLSAALADRYTIERELGRGGMAVVYLARDLKHERLVALKVLRPELAATVGAERFLREIRIAAQLNHPHILPLLDSGTIEKPLSDRPPDRLSALLYYVMPYVDGESLRDKLSRERELPVSEAVRILRDVVDALAMAHSHGVVHRDIKPDNVMLSGRHALVADFGVAKALSQAAGAQDVTTAGVALGTPAYMSPEQAVADDQVDHRSDIYAVGALAYELLTGRPPFLGTSAQMVLSAHVADMPERVTKYRDTVSPPLEHLVLRCLEKKPADRWQSAEELLTQLEALSTPSGGMTPTTTRPVATVAVRKRKRLVWGAIAAALIAGAVPVALLLRPESGVALDPNRVVVAEFRNETGDSSLDLVGRMAGDWITHGIQQTGTVQVLSWETALRMSLFVQGEANAGRVLDPVRALAEETGAGIVISGRYYLEGDDIRIQADVNDAGRSRLLGSIDPVRGSRDSVSLVIGRLQQRVMGFLAVRYDERLAPTVDLAGDPPPYDAYQAFNEGMERSIRGEDPKPYLRRAIELDPEFAEAMLQLVTVHHNAVQLVQADSVLDVMMALGDRLTPYYRAYGEAMRARLDNDRERALILARRAAELAPGSRAWHLVGVLSVWTNRPREAVDAYTAVDPASDVFRGNNSYWAFLTGALHTLNEHERELQVAQQFREIYPERTIHSLVLQARALAGLGRSEELHRVLDELAGASNPYRMREAFLDAAQIFLSDGRENEAREVLSRAIDWLEARPLDEIADLDHQEDYGEVLFLAGSHDEAQQVFDALVSESAIPGRNVGLRGRRAIIAAIRGDSSLALEDEAWLAGVKIPYFEWWATHQRALIAGALGRREEAVMLLRQAYEQGGFYSWHTQVTWTLDPLRGYPLFEEWLRPKG